MNEEDAQQYFPPTFTPMTEEDQRALLWMQNREKYFKFKADMGVTLQSDPQALYEFHRDWHSVVAWLAQRGA